MFGLPIGPLELVLILVVAVLLFGGRLPEVSRSIGKSLREFQRGFRELKDEINRDGNLQEDLRDALYKDLPNSWQDPPTTASPPAAEADPPRGDPEAPPALEADHLPPPEASDEVALAKGFGPAGPWNPLPGPPARDPEGPPEEVKPSAP